MPNDPLTGLPELPPQVSIDEAIDAAVRFVTGPDYKPLSVDLEPEASETLAWGVSILRERYGLDQEQAETAFVHFTILRTQRAAECELRRFIFWGDR